MSGVWRAFFKTRQVVEEYETADAESVAEGIVSDRDFLGYYGTWDMAGTWK